MFTDLYLLEQPKKFEIREVPIPKVCDDNILLKGTIVVCVIALIISLTRNNPNQSRCAVYVIQTGTFTMENSLQSSL